MRNKIKYISPLLSLFRQKKYDVFLFKQRSYVTKFWMFSDVTDILSLRIDFYK